jgi:hypothetical protein
LRFFTKSRFSGFARFRLHLTKCGLFGSWMRYTKSHHPNEGATFSVSVGKEAENFYDMNRVSRIVP